MPPHPDQSARRPARMASAASSCPPRAISDRHSCRAPERALAHRYDLDSPPQPQPRRSARRHRQPLASHPRVATARSIRSGQRGRGTRRGRPSGPRLRPDADRPRRRRGRDQERLRRCVDRVRALEARPRTNRDPFPQLHDRSVVALPEAPLDRPASAPFDGQSPDELPFGTGAAGPTNSPKPNEPLAPRASPRTLLGGVPSAPDLSNDGSIERRARRSKPVVHEPRGAPRTDIRARAPRAALPRRRSNWRAPHRPLCRDLARHLQHVVVRSTAAQRCAGDAARSGPMSPGRARCSALQHRRESRAARVARRAAALRSHKIERSLRTIVIGDDAAHRSAKQGLEIDVRGV